jgi:putative DNA-invertase from lambdoid prophage Rac
MEENKNIIGYARTSTKEQNIDTQILQLKNKNIPDEQIFFDEGVSGSVPANQRKGFKQLLDFVDENEVNTIYVFEISRLG